MTNLFFSSVLLFLLTIFHAKAQTQDAVKFKITPNIFDSTATFSFYIPTGDTVSIIIFDRMARRVATIIPLKYFPAGNHDTICNLSFLLPKKYLAQLGFGRMDNSSQKGGPRRISVITVQELLTRRSPNADKKRDNYTDTTRRYWKNK